MRQFAPNKSGFTTIEIICVLLIIGILSAVAVSRFASSDEYSLVAEAETLKTHLRYAQFRAMSDDVKWRAELTSTSYTLSHYQASDDTWPTSNLPDTPDSAIHTFAGGITLTGGDQNVVFDQWGSPGTTDLTLTLDNGNTTRTISIIQNTGFIP